MFKFWSSDRSIYKVVVILALCVIAEVYLEFALNEWRGTFWSAISRKDMHQFYSLVGLFSGYAFVLIFANAYDTYLQGLVALKWRIFNTDRYVSLFINNQSVAIDNPGQRIEQDLNLFARLFISLVIGVLSNSVLFVVFSVVLYQFGLYILLAAYVYVILGNIATYFIGRPLVQMTILNQRYAADFRLSLEREVKNESSSRSVFESIIENTKTILIKSKQINLFNITYGQISIILPIFLVAPMYFKGTLDFGNLMQAINAFAILYSSATFFSSNFSDFAETLASYKRLQQFILKIS
jgi:putative ATP-binding cassette transporter